MNWMLVIVVILVFLIFVSIIYSNIKKGKLSLDYSILWMSLAMVIFVLMVTPVDIVNKLANLLGFEVASNLIFFVSIFLLAIIVFFLTRRLSVQKMKIDSLVQEVAILKDKVNNDK